MSAKRGRKGSLVGLIFVCSGGRDYGLFLIFETRPFDLSDSDPSTFLLNPNHLELTYFHETHQVCGMQKFTLANLIVSRRTSGQTYCSAVP